MKVLELTQRFPPAIGGVEEHVFRLASGLDGMGVEVEVLTTDLLREAPFARIGPNPPSFPFRVTRVRAVRTFDVPLGLGIIAPGMIPVALAREPDVIHAHSYGHFPSFVASLAGRLDHSVFILTTHSDAGRPSLAKALFDRLIPPLTVRTARRVIAVSRHEASYLSRLGVPPDKIVVIPNGVDIAEFAEPPSRPIRDEINGLFVGRMDPDHKGLEVLIRAMARLPRTPGIRVRLVGEDCGRNELLRALAHRLGVGDRVVFAGKLHRPELLRAYADADFLVLPSLFEPFGIVVLEAMAAGLPVIASRVGGIPEVVVDGETGILVEPGHPRELAEAIVRISGDEGLRRSMGRAARERVTDYAWDSILARIRAVYSQALEERRG